MQRLIRAGLILLIALGLSACIYKPDVQQGNVITDVDLKGLHIGMTKDEVRALFGDPVLSDLYDESRMIYVYTFKHRYKKMQETRLVIYLRSDRVSNFWTDHLPVPEERTLPKP